MLQKVSYYERKGEGEERKKKSVNFAEEEKFPYYHLSELVMYSVITHVLSNNVKINTKAGYSKVVFNS